MLLRRWVLAFCILAAAPLAAASLPSGVPPSAPDPMVDLAGMLSAPTKQQLNALLRERWRANQLQLAVLTLPSLEGRAIEDIGITVARSWGLGGVDADNGVLLLIARDDRALRIEVGQKLEGVLTDAACKRIIEDVMVPLLRAGRSDAAVQAGVSAILARLDPTEEEVSGGFAPAHLPVSSSPSQTNVPWGLLAAIAGGFVLWSLLHMGEAKASAQRNGFGAAPPLWVYMAGYCLLTFLWLMLRIAARGKGGGSGRSSGGFGGGGGGFSGGGASGKW